MGINHITLKHEKGKHLGLEKRLFIQKFYSKFDWSPYDLAVELGCLYNTYKKSIKNVYLRRNKNVQSYVQSANTARVDKWLFR